ncbi:hypothetical protein CA51_23510 [Rosistilla oblonga]|nr:hypothetical protein CA51_23510 [Rosistilla oblonga]
MGGWYAVGVLCTSSWENDAGLARWKFQAASTYKHDAIKWGQKQVVAWFNYSAAVGAAVRRRVRRFFFSAPHSLVSDSKTSGDS